MHRHLSIASIALVGALAIAGCSGGDSQPASPPLSGAPAAASPGADGKTAEAAKKTVEDYFTMSFGGDEDGACRLLSPDYQQKQIDDSEEFGKAATDCPGAVKAGAVFSKVFGFDPDALQVTETTVSGDTASVLSVSEAPFEDTVYSLMWDGSTWLITGDESASDAKADPARWLANWCKVMPGTTVAQAVSLMGDFTGDFQEDDGGGQVEWSKNEFSFTAFLAGGKIIQLDANPRQLTATDKAKLRCDSTRT